MQARRIKTNQLAARFELKSQAGTGGMGTVYQAVDSKTGELVAVKVLHTKSATDAARFKQEAALLAELQHPAIVRYVAHGVTEQGEPYIAMEWLEGETLEERLARGPLSPGLVARLAHRVLEALAVAHGRGVVHRDIKPSNVFLCGWRIADAKLLDFGIARRLFDEKRFTRAGSTVGTPMYTAPEQARGERNVDVRADIFSLGCVLYECLTGMPPFVGDTPGAVMAKICLGTAPPIIEKLPTLDPELAVIVQVMLAQERRQRPNDAGILARKFAAIAARLDLSGGSEPPPTRSRDVLTDGEQRVMSIVVVRPASRTPVPTRPSPNATTCVVPVAQVQESLASGLPPEALTALSSAVEPFGGRVDRLLDRSLVVTVSHLPGILEQVEQAARLAVRVRTCLPDASIAIGTGRGVLLARLPVGDVVESAADVLERAAPGAIRLDEASARLLATRFVVHEDARGRTLGDERDGEEGARAVLGGQTPFFGRERELSSLKGLFEECLAESVSRVAVVTGVAGVGKTRLLRELVPRLADLGVTPKVIWTRAVPVRSTVAFLPVRPLLLRAGINVTSDPDPLEVRSALAKFLVGESKGAPLILVVEDLHHADLGTVQLLESMLRSLGNLPFLLVAVGRPDVEERFPGLFADRAPLAVRLTTFSRRGAESLLARIARGLEPPAQEWVLSRADGVPLFLEELARFALVPSKQALPDTVVGVMQSRLETFTPEARRVLRAASLFGEAITADGVAVLLGDKLRRDVPAILRELVEAEILVPVDGAGDLRFVSTLFREAVYSTLPPGDRALGRRLARAVLDQEGRTLPEFLMLGRSQSDRAALSPIPPPPLRASA